MGLLMALFFAVLSIAQFSNLQDDGTAITETGIGSFFDVLTSIAILFPVTLAAVALFYGAFRLFAR